MTVSESNILELPNKGPDLNLIQNLWGELKIKVTARRFSNLKKLELIIKDKSLKRFDCCNAQNNSSMDF